MTPAGMDDINPYPLSGRVTAPPPGVRLAINRWERGRKVVNPELGGATPLSKWLWITEVKVWLKRRQEVTGQRWLTGRPQRGNGSRPHTRVYKVSTRKEPGVQYHPKVTENGHTERSNLSVALRTCSEQEPTASGRWGGWLKKQMPWVMPRIG